MVESLGNFAARKRGTRSRQDVADQAKKRGFNISQAYIQKIETGDVASPSLDKIDALAAGLGVNPDYLVALARGQDPSATASEPGPVMGLLNNLGEVAFPPTAEERRLIAEAEALQMYVGLFTEPGFWNQPPDVRRRLLRDVEGAIDETRAMYRLMGKELPNGS